MKIVKTTSHNIPEGSHVVAKKQFWPNDDGGFSLQWRATPDGFISLAAFQNIIENIYSVAYDDLSRLSEKGLDYGSLDGGMRVVGGKINFIMSSTTFPSRLESGGEKEVDHNLVSSILYNHGFKKESA